VQKGVKDVAKDGTARGGARVGAGRKPKALNEKVVSGKGKDALVLPEPADIEGFDMPEVRAYLNAPQKNGKPLLAAEIYAEVYAWLKSIRCDGFVNSQLIEQFAMSEARRIQCEEALSEYGFLAKHPTTGNAIASPYVSMLMQFSKQASQSWYQIYQIIKENGSVSFDGGNPQDDLMERLLSTRKGGAR